MVFGDEALAEFGGACGFLGVESFGFAGEDLAEIGDVAIEGVGAVMGDAHGFGDGFSFEKQESADFFFMGQGGSHVVDAAAARQQLLVLFLPVSR